MADEQRANAGDTGDERATPLASGESSDADAPAETPFDNPFFLPVVLWALAAWFGWDIVTNAPAYQEYPRFNQGGFAILSVAAIWFTWGALKERRAGRESGGAESD